MPSLAFRLAGMANASEMEMQPEGSGTSRQPKKSVWARHSTLGLIAIAHDPAGTCQKRSAGAAVFPEPSQFYILQLSHSTGFMFFLPLPALTVVQVGRAGDGRARAREGGGEGALMGRGGRAQWGGGGGSGLVPHGQTVWLTERDDDWAKNGAGTCSNLPLLSIASAINELPIRQRNDAEGSL